jgi:hypothetical protein
MKTKTINLTEVARQIQEEGYKSYMGVTREEIESALYAKVGAFVDEVLTELEHLEHPEPRTKEEYNEKLGLYDKE